MVIPSPTTGPDEARLAALRSFRVAEAVAEPGLDRITQLASATLGMPVAWISLVDDAWMLPQACFGGALERMPRHGLPCERAMAADDVLVIGNLHRDERFDTAAFPEPMRAMRFYAGAPLVTAEGRRIGAFGVMDWSPNRVLSAWQRTTLAGFAVLAVEQIELRRSDIARTAVTGSAEASDHAFVAIDPDGICTFVNGAARGAVPVRRAQHDELTGLANRAGFDERLGAALRAGERPCILLLDLNAFREVNESHGHAVGDALLRAVAMRLSLCVAQGILVARVGGDEFALILPSGSNAAVATSCAATILDAFRPPLHVGGHTFHVGVSIGAVIGADAAVSPDDLLDDANLALTQAKSDGRRCLRVFDPTLRRAALARRTLHDDLSRALEDGEFVLHYQPQVTLGTGRVIGVEALLRWQHPQRGLLLPGAFLSALEAHPRVVAVGRWIVEESCRQAAAWRAAKLPPLRVAVNLFEAQLRTGTLAPDVMTALGRYRLEPDTFEVEVTESITLQGDDAVLDSLRELHARGIAIAFDDFGTGYASLSSLKRVPLKRLKIDRSFVRDVLTGQHDAGIIRAVLGMAESFGLEVIAEGIENPEQETVLRAMGCHEGQGFLYGRAMTPTQISDLVRSQGDRCLNAA